MRRRDTATRTASDAVATRVRSIVVVDDDVVVPMTLMIALPGTTVIEASRQGAGFETICSVQPDAVVIDRRMPDGDGLELVRIVRSDPVTHDIPIVVLTAGFDEADRPEVMEAGADAYLGKPCDPEDLLSVIEALIAARPPRQPRAVTTPPIADAYPDASRAHRHVPVRAAGRSNTGLPPPGTRRRPAPLAPAPPHAAPLPVRTPAKVTADAVAVSESLACAEERADANAAEAVSLHAALHEACEDNKRLLSIVNSLEAQLLNAEHDAKVAGDLVDALRRELDQALSDIERLRSPAATAPPEPTRQRITRKQPPAAQTKSHGAPSPGVTGAAKASRPRTPTRRAPAAKAKATPAKKPRTG